jgi:nucleoside phosphorylase
MSAPKPIHVSEISGRVHAAIITVRLDEYDAVDFLLAHSVAVEGGNNSYEYATIESDNLEPISVVLTRCVGQGNTAAQSVANNIIYDIDPSWLLLVGIAGGVPDNEYSLGDVVLASALHDFSFGAANEGSKRTYQTSGGAMHPEVIRFLSTKIGGKNRKRLIDLSGFTTEEKFLTHPGVFAEHLNDSNAFYGDTDFQNDVRRKLAKRYPEGSRNGSPVVWSGPCVNGNLLLKDTKLLKKWQESARQVVQVETELAGVYEAAHSAGRQNYPVLAIRGLSDIVGLKRDPDWTQYACQTAAALTYAILRSGFIDFSKNLPTRRSTIFSDPTNALDKLANAVIKPKGIPKRQLKRYQDAVAESYSYLNSAANLVLFRLGDLQNMKKADFLNDLHQLDNIEGWHTLERNVRLCSNLRTIPTNG